MKQWERVQVYDPQGVLDYADPGSSLCMSSTSFGVTILEEFLERAVRPLYCTPESTIGVHRSVYKEDSTILGRE